MTSKTVLSHQSAGGAAHMIDVGGKTATLRNAVATACVHTTREVVEAVMSGGTSKGDVVAVARVAGILAAKNTANLIPLCHPIQTTRADVDFEPSAREGELRVTATIEAVDRTGVEMEAMVAASIAALTVYDMIKSADRWASIDAVRLESKSGGKSGAVMRSALVASARSARPERPEDAHPQGTATLAFAALTDGPLSVDDVIARVAHPGAGAVCAFLGMVRNQNDGRSVEKLEYEAYPGMAVAEMRHIAEQITVEIPGVRVAVTHRTGVLHVGALAVACAASAPHRADAYRACRTLIDRVKATVPIWKREHGPDGSSWVGWQDARCGGHHAHDTDVGEE